MYYFQNIFVSLNVILPFLACVCVGLRFQARYIQQLPAKGDDWVILAALIVTLASSIGCIYAVYTANYGNLILLLTPEQSINFFKFLYYDVILISLVLGLIKISVILFYKRIFMTSTFKLWANIFLGIVIAWTIAGVLSSIFRDNPISNYWTHEAETSYDFGTYNITMCVLDIFFDLAILCLPLPVIRRLQISTKKKVSLIGVFWLGMFCMAASGVRLYYGKYLTDVADTPMFIMANPEAATYISNSAALWSQIECSVSIITACLPTLVPVAVKFRMASQALMSWTKGLSRTSLTRGTGSSRTDMESQARLPHQSMEKTAVTGSLRSLPENDSGSGSYPMDRIHVGNTYTVSSGQVQGV